MIYDIAKVKLYGDNNDRLIHYKMTNVTAGKRISENLTERIQKFQDQLKSEYVYRIPLKYLCDVGLLNQCFKFSTKYILTLETDMENYLRQIKIKR